jgi:hypothetical protein
MKKINITAEVSPEVFVTFRNLVMRETKSFTEERWLTDLFTQFLMAMSFEDLTRISNKIEKGE